MEYCLCKCEKKSYDPHQYSHQAGMLLISDPIANVPYPLTGSQEINSLVTADKLGAQNFDSESQQLSGIAVVG